MVSRIGWFLFSMMVLKTCHALNSSLTYAYLSNNNHNNKFSRQKWPINKKVNIGSKNISLIWT